jgi:hypothetical protein
LQSLALLARSRAAATVGRIRITSSLAEYRQRLQH